MNKTIILTEEQLDFISFMSIQTAPSPFLKKRLKSLTGKLPLIVKSSLDNGKEKQGKIQAHHSPMAMIEFLSLFSRDDEFKWYTHKWDQEELSLDHLIKKQDIAKQRLLKMVYESEHPVNDRTFYQVWNFINFLPKPENTYPWHDNSGKAYRIGWHSIVDIHQQNPETAIENLMLPNGHLFIDYIRLFKCSIEFRTDLGMDGRFNRFVKNSMKRFINGAVNISYSENLGKIGKDINIYCDITGVYEGLSIICDWIVKYKVNGSTVRVNLISKEDGYELKILHEGSYFSNLKKLKTPSGDLEKLRNRLFSVCDLTMSGDHILDGKQRESVSVHVLEDTTTKIEENLSPCRLEYIDRQVGGVEYTLKFYK